MAEDKVLGPEELENVAGGNDDYYKEKGNFLDGKIFVVCQKCQDRYLLEPEWIGRKHKDWRTDCDGIFAFHSSVE